MKKTLKIVAISLVSILAIMLIIPFAFKGPIKKTIEKEINSKLNAKVSFDGINLSLFRHFPDLTVKIKDLKVIGNDDFANDTLANLPALSLTIDLKSVLKGSDYKVKKIILTSPRLQFKVLVDGQVNWDITKPSTDKTASEASAFKVYLDKINITDGYLLYDDAEIPTRLSFDGFDGDLSGDMTNDITKLTIDAKVKSILADYNGVRYLSKATAELKTKLDSDLAKWIFTFKDGNLKLNDLSITADGFFAMPDEGYKMDILFSARENTFKSFLSLIPSLYAKDFNKIKASGNMAFDGYVKGLYSDISMPAFGVNLKVDNGAFSYPNLPGQVSDVNIIASVTNPDGIMDHTLVDVPKLHLKMINNPLDATLVLKTPVTDPDINATLKGILDLTDISKIYPLGDNTNLSGSINADITLAGKISAIEKGDYDQFKALGSALFKNVKYSGKEVAQPIEINSAQLDFNPAYIQLSGMDVKIGDNDIAANGKLENYLPWFLKKNSILKGSLSTISNYMNINSLIGSSESSVSKTNDAPLTVIEIPANLDISLNTTFKHIIYDTYDMQDMKGSVNIKDRTLVLNDLDFGMLGGTMKLAGSYNAIDPQKPQVDMDMKITKVSMTDAFKTFNTMQQLAPFASNLSGKISTNMKFKGLLKNDMMPDLTSISVYGLVLSDILRISGTHALTRIADILKIDKLKNPAIEKLNLSFDIIDGRATIKPMDFKLGNYTANFSGTTGLDQMLNLILNLDIPRSEFGSKANSVLDGLVKDASKKGVNVTLGDLIPVTVLIGGTFSDPKITTGIKSAMADMAEDLKKQALDQVEKKKEELISKAKDEAGKFIAQADAQATKILNDAETQGQRLITLANQAAEKVKIASDSTANKIIAEGNKNGPIAAFTAKKAAETVKKEGNQKAEKLLNEAQQQKDALMNRARNEADKIKQDALNRVNK